MDRVFFKHLFDALCYVHGYVCVKERENEYKRIEVEHNSSENSVFHITLTAVNIMKV